jgi:hypothetical protein
MALSSLCSFVVLDFEFRALHLLVVGSTLPLEPCLQSFCFRYFLNKVMHLCLGWPRYHALPLAGLTGAHRLALKGNPSDLCLLSS